MTRQPCEMCLGTGEEKYYIEGNFELADCWECQGTGYSWTTKIKKVEENGEEPEREFERA